MPSLFRQLALRLFPGGCRITADEIRVRHRDGWVAIPMSQVHAVKFRNVSRVIVRLFDGRRLVLNLFRFPNGQYDRVCNALREAQRANEARRAARLDAIKSEEPNT